MIGFASLAGLARLGPSRGRGIGPELLLNGAFAADTNWTKDAGWTIAGGVLAANAGAFTLTTQSAVPLISGRRYRVTFSITAFTSGAVRIRFNDGASAVGASRAAVGTYTEEFIAGAAANQVSFQALAAGFVGSIDNASVRLL